MSQTSSPVLFDTAPSRFAASLPVAGAIAGGLALGMIALISVEFEPGPRTALPDFDIFPVEDDIEAPTRTLTLEPLGKVDVPPAPQPLSTDRSTTPVMAPVELAGKAEPFAPRPLDFGPVTFRAGDANPEPLVRIPPVTPMNAERSGHCDMVFALSTTGKPTDIEATCSDRVFRRASVRAVSEWLYAPALQDGVAVPRSGVTTRLTYVVTDSRGNPIPPR